MVAVEVNGDPKVRFDHGHFSQVMWNLCRNALRHCQRREGSIRIAVAAPARDNRVRLDVCDDGAGVPPQLRTLDRIGRQVRTLADRVRFASYEFAGVFAAHKIRQPELTALHDFDVKLLEEIPRLQTCLQALADRAAEPTGFAEAAQAAADEPTFRTRTDERDKLARGL